jgi:hypothetical protein
MLIFAGSVFAQENIEISFKISNSTGSPISNAEVRILNSEKCSARRDLHFSI